MAPSTKQPGTEVILIHWIKNFSSTHLRDPCWKTEQSTHLRALSWSTHLRDLCWKINERLEIKQGLKKKLDFFQQQLSHTIYVVSQKIYKHERRKKSREKIVKDKNIQQQKSSKKEIRGEYIGEGHYLCISNSSILESWKLLFEVFIYLMLIEIIINSHLAPFPHSYLSNPEFEN